MRTIILTAMAAFLAWPCAAEQLPAKRGDAGTAGSRTEVGAAKAAAKTGSTVTGSIRIKGTRLKTEGSKSEKDVVVYLEPAIRQEFQAPKKQAVIDQKKLVFLPHVIAVQKGATVEVLNSDPVVHNLHTVARKNATVNSAVGPQASKKLTLTQAEVVRVVCDIHPEMAAYIVVVDTPYFTVAEIDGKTQTATYTIGNVPPGKYVLKAWNKNRKIEKFKKEITVKKGSTAQVDIQLKKKSRRRRR